ncbi:hypothetical protein BDN71DRAFT_1143935 [Pleurotus eryngii]|uniref:Uncharacterized protein n=1 Tax=Pleurotus eryngii TaxID=5323 RepID=A0A9P6DJI7_PLEER|nr:hypothetical protein BDN71DRAFT_1143935 [Pleurotus eryngii]
MQPPPVRHSTGGGAPRRRISQICCALQLFQYNRLIDACPIGNTFGLRKGVNCGGHLQTILNQCNFNGRVRGTLFPMLCNQVQGFDVSYKV